MSRPTTADAALGQPAGRGRRADLPDPGRHSRLARQFRQPARRTLCRGRHRRPTAASCRTSAPACSVPRRGASTTAGKPQQRSADASEPGIKTCFCSDCSPPTAAMPWRPSAIKTSSAARTPGCRRAPAAGRCHAVRYAASAEVYHSHDYRLLEESSAAISTSACLLRPRALDTVPSAGARVVRAKRYVSPRYRPCVHAGALYRVPEIALRSVSAARLPPWPQRHPPVALKRRISMFPGYWK